MKAILQPKKTRLTRQQAMAENLAKVASATSNPALRRQLHKTIKMLREAAK